MTFGIFTFALAAIATGLLSRVKIIGYGAQTVFAILSFAFTMWFVFLMIFALFALFLTT